MEDQGGMGEALAFPNKRNHQERNEEVGAHLLAMVRGHLLSISSVFSCCRS